MFKRYCFSDTNIINDRNSNIDSDERTPTYSRVCQ